MAQAPRDVPQRLVHAEAVRSGWDADTPPATGWEPVQLPDNWAVRWPGFDGVVWYRLHWNEPAADPPAPRALLAEYFNMAAAVYVNGSLVGRDRRLTEPLSRSWNLPRRWTIDAPLLRPGRNELLLRVSGLAAYQPGAGPLTLGTPAQIAPLLDRVLVERRSVQWLGIGLTLVMAVLFGMLWMLRRSETAYGWFAAFSLAWLPYSYNYIATEAWPLPSTDSFQRLNVMALLLSIAMFVQFALSFCQFAMPRLRRASLGLAALAELGLLLAPVGAPLALARTIGVHTALALFVLASGLIVWRAARTRAPEAIAMGACTLLPMVAGVHDALVFMQVLPGNRYYVTTSSSAMLLGISFVLTWRLVLGMRLVENFNAELQARVADATARLSDLLGRQHAAELLQTRLGERLSLVRDLHDGLGMTLNGHIHRLRAETAAGDAQALHALEEISADLRLIMESSALEADEAFIGRLAPLRHRTTRILEAADIDCRWELHALEDYRMDSRRALDLLRLLQEALTNVLRHSRAGRVHVLIDAREPRLVLAVTDDGVGLSAAGVPGATAGLGIPSMHARARRLQGTLSIESDAHGTRVRLSCPK